MNELAWSKNKKPGKKIGTWSSIAETKDKRVKSIPPEKSGPILTVTKIHNLLILLNSKF